MKSFKSYIEEQFFVEFIINEFNQQSDHKWKAKKQEIIDSWKGLRSDVPIYMTPLSPQTGEEDNKSYGEDGIRISGSWQFIASVLGRIKDLLQYENDETRLRLVFKGVDKGDENKQTFVFYVNTEERKKKGIGNA